MKKFKRILRSMGLIFMIILASIGLGMGAVFLLAPQRKRDDDFAPKTELVEGKLENLKLRE